MNINYKGYIFPNSYVKDIITITNWKSKAYSFVKNY